MEKGQEQPRLLTTGEIAQYCRVTHRAVLKWVASGKIKAFRTPGNHSRITMDDFIAFLHHYRMPIPEELKSQETQKKILIVDDDRGIVHSLQRVLMMENKYTLDKAFDGFEAGQKFEAFKPHLIILDLNMPGLNGFQVCEQIRATHTSQQVKILIISGTNNPQEIKRVKDLGADDFLEKPFSNEALQNKIKGMLGVL